VAGGIGWLTWPLHWLLGMRGMLFPWVPVFLALGIGLWFGLDMEPGFWAYVAALGLFAGALALRVGGPELTFPLAILAGSLALGFLATGLRAHLVAAPMLERPYYGPVQGRIIEIDRSQSDALRLTLDQVVLSRIAPDKTPHSVRISLHGAVPAPDPGQVVLVTARLAAPEGPTEPGGFDFRRMAFFDRLGAVGYTRSPVVLWEEAAPGAQRVNRLRMYLSRAIMAALPGDAGAFASGAMTGDRSGISQDTVKALRDSNLAHLLAISGMNMAFLTGFIFMLLRYGLALLPWIALRLNTKKAAAVVAFAVALFYLALSGANVATERAFLMVTVMLGAVMLDRRALTLRSVALAAAVLLLWQPESLTEPGFQLSFAATVALIAAFGALDRGVMRERLPRWIMPVFTLVLSSVVAGLATAPFAAAHFNRFTDYGLVANLLTVPVMSLLMAAGAVASLLAPFGLAGPALWVMELAARWILFVAHWIAGLEGAVTPVVAPGPWVLPLITLAGCWLILMQGRVRALAALPLITGFGLWALTERPPVLISSNGALVGIMGPKGRTLSVAKGAGFTAETWLEKDGDLALQEEAFLRAGFSGPQGARMFVFGQTFPQVAEDRAGGASSALQPPPAAETARAECVGRMACEHPLRGIVMSGKSADVAKACANAGLVILSGTVPDPAERPKTCVILDQSLLRRTGALALWPGETGWLMIPARRSARIWMGQQPPPDLPTLQ
jgi:competence protein ComEC